MGVPQQVLLGGSSIPATISFTDDSFDATNATTYTFSSQSLGTAAANRKILVGAVAGNGNFAISSMTIGGVSAALVTGASGSRPNTNCEIWQADVPTGTTGDIVITWGGGRSRCGIGVWAVYGGAPSATTASSAVDSNTLTISTDVPAGGVAVGIATDHLNTAPTFTWTGIAEDFDTGIEASQTYSGAHAAFATTQTGLSIVATLSGGFGEDILCVASFGPA